MGLDMYLSKRTFIGANYEHRNVKGSIRINVAGKPVKIKFKRLNEIKEAVGYWRKANHIHRWFVENVQKGVDDCGEYYVTREKLSELIDLCSQIIKDKSLAPSLMPTESGFFFGGTEYDNYYIEDLKSTVKMLKPLLLEEGGDFYYQSSW